MWKQIEDTFVQLYTTLVPQLYSSPSFTTLKDGTTVLAYPGGKEGIKIWKIMQERHELLTTLNESSIGPIQFSQDGRYLFVNRENDMQIWTGK